MKCLVLAGGRGNSLWPVSRGDYPKQFIEIREGHSLFQSTIARNIAFCDEFLITTHAGYHFIVEGQMQAFRGIRYRSFLEEERMGTCFAISLVCMLLNPSELVLVVSSDQVIEGSDYKEAIIQGSRLAREGKLVTFGMQVLSPRTDYGYIRHDGDTVIEFREKPNPEHASLYMQDGSYLWNSGNCMFQAGDFLQELQRLQPEMYQAIHRIRQRIPQEGQSIRVRKETLSAEEGWRKAWTMSVEHAVLEHSGKVSVVEAEFHWWDMGSLDVLSAYMTRMNGRNSILEDAPGSTVINNARDQLVVINGVEGLSVVNTEDACYITTARNPDGIKEVIREHPEYRPYFEQSHVVYRPWGTYEVLARSEHYKVKKVCVYPGRSLSSHLHSLRSEQWSVVEGTASVRLEDKSVTLKRYDSLQVPVNTRHALANETDQPLTVIEVSFGPQVIEEDHRADAEVKDRPLTLPDELVLLEPAFKDYLWGGTLLRDRYGKHCDYEVIAESWELSAHKDGQSRIGSGRYEGLLFTEYLRKLPEEALGWKCQAFEKFPLLIKFIDARKSLSVQVHPDDRFALPTEHEYGKNEMWYVMDCEPGASLYWGLKQDVTPEELRERAQDHTITDILNRVEVHPGDTFFIEAGTIHAIGAGILICEIQQNSNCTYRLYDYGRKDRLGQERPLHLDRAMQVANCRRTVSEPVRYPAVEAGGVTRRLLCECKYFTSVLYEVREGASAQVTMDPASFCSLVFLEGTGVIHGERQRQVFHPADSFFIPAGDRKITVEGASRFILTRL